LEVIPESERKAPTPKGGRPRKYRPISGDQKS
jgi:hypothetical protein